MIVITRRLFPIFLMALLCAFSNNVHAQMGGGRAANVIIAPAEQRDFADIVEALGTTRANENIIVTADTAAKIQEIHFQDGQQVQKGDLILVLDKDQEDAQLKAAQALYEERSVAFRRAGQLQQSSAISAATLDERRAQLKQAEADIEAIKSRIDRLVIRAPFDGVLGLREVSVGALIQPGDTITTLDDLSVMKVDFDVPSIFLSSLQAGQKIEGRIDAYPDRLFTGTVQTINPQIDAVTRTVRVRAIVPNPDMIMRPGLLMTISLARLPRLAIVVPEEALIKRGSDNFVFVVAKNNEGKDIVNHRKVQINGRKVGYVEIVEGLGAGDKVVIHGQDNLSEGTMINIRAEKTDPSQTLQDLLNGTTKAE